MSQRQHHLLQSLSELTLGSHPPIHSLSTIYFGWQAPYHHPQATQSGANESASGGVSASEGVSERHYCHGGTRTFAGETARTQYVRWKRFVKGVQRGCVRVCAEGGCEGVCMQRGFHHT